MTTKRAPRWGEVWTNEDGTSFLCIDDVPDDDGEYGWQFCGWDGESTYKMYCPTEGMTPLVCRPPEMMMLFPWHGVRANGELSRTGWQDVDAALGCIDQQNTDAFVGAINVATGEWVSAWP